MSLQITELNDNMKHVRRAPQGDERANAAVHQVAPSPCMCANRYGTSPAWGKGEQPGTLVYCRKRATFADLGR